ncbi:MAG: hypothetical protein AAF614_34885 [Chloroflexota bacterium]
MQLRKEPIPQQHWPDFTVPYEQRYEWRFPGEEAHLPRLQAQDAALRQQQKEAR